MSENLEQKTLDVDGMTCNGCVVRIEKELKKLEGLIDVKATYNSSKVFITYDVNMLELKKVIEAIERLGYKVESLHKKSQVNNKENKMGLGELTGISIIILALYLIIKNTIGFNFIPEVDNSMGYGLLFIVGLLTSLHCITMCGGINLSVCLKYREEKNKKKFTKIKPSASYNLGRVISYTILGGLVGALGSVVSFSGSTKGIVAIISGLFMVLMGFNMLNIFPWLRKFNPRLPNFLSKLNNSSGKKAPIILGIFNGLMPCGPLQAMQLYALGTGSFINGAISMFVFSLGTVPLMFGFGAISSILSGKFTKRMMKASAVLVIILGFIMFNRGLSLSGYNIALALGTSQGVGGIAKIENGVQVVTTEIEPARYYPIIVQKGIPVKWIIKADKKNLNGCNYILTSPDLNIEKKLTVGENIIEFTPTKEGNFVYTCWMGMISSSIKVVDDLSKVSEKDLEEENKSSIQSCAINNGNYSINSNTTKLSVDEIAVAKIEDDVQNVKIEVNENGFSPAVVVMQKGVKTSFIIEAKNLNYCNNKIVFPEYDASLTLKKGQNKIELVPKIDFSFRCWMGMLNGYVKVVDEISKIDLNEIKKEVSNIEVPGGSCGGTCCGL